MIEQAFMASAGIIILLAGLLILKKKKTVFWISIIIAFSPLVYFSRYFGLEGPINLAWVNFFALTGVGIIISMFKVKKMYVPTSMALIYGAIFIVHLMSLFLNHSSLFSFIFAQRNYIMLFSYFAVFRIVLDIYNKDEIMGFIVNLGIASSIIAYIQRLVFVSILRLGSGDMVTGFFNNDGIFLYFQLVALTTVFVYWFQEKRLPNLLFSKPIAFFLIFSTLAIANNKAGLVLVVISLAFAAFKLGPLTLLKHASKIVIGVVAFLIILTVYEGYHNEAYGDDPEDTYTKNITDMEFWSGYLFGDDEADSQYSKSGALKRGAAAVFAHDVIQKSSFHYLFGRGPGSTPQTSFKGATNFLDKQYPGLKIGRTAISFFLAETGILGLILNILFIVSLLFWRPPGFRYEPKRFRIIRQVFIFVTFLFLFYENLYAEPIWGLSIVLILYPSQSQLTKIKKGVVKKSDLVRV